MPEPSGRIAYSIDEICKMSGLGRTFLYEEIGARRLIVTKAGRRSIVLYDDMVAWLAKLPKLTPREQ
jgi:hypothetical protein